MPETMESARRWSGFVCPDCRFVFRVPRDHDGRGVVCPSCRRLLKIPLPDDVVPPLVVPLLANPSSIGEKKRRKGKSRRRALPDWENDEEDEDSPRQGRRGAPWVLIGGVALFALMLAAVLVTMLNGVKESPVPTNVVSAPASVPSENAGEEPLSDAAFRAAAEPLAAKFLAATRVEDLLPLVRDPKRAEPRLRAAFPDGVVGAPGMAAFDTRSEVVRKGEAFRVRVRTADMDEKPMAFFMTPDGLKIDWESWAGWSEMPWADFMAAKPATPKLFRVWLGEVDYYNFGFTDDLKWRSYRMESPDGMHVLYGYVERGSEIDKLVHVSPDEKRTALTLMLSFPENASSQNQVLIKGLAAEGWVLETGK